MPNIGQREISSAAPHKNPMTVPRSAPPFLAEYNGRIKAAAPPQDIPKISSVPSDETHEKNTAPMPASYFCVYLFSSSSTSEYTYTIKAPNITLNTPENKS